jgi:hypothetical protein
LLLEYRQVEALDANVLAAIKYLCRNDVSSKVNVFGWRLLLNRLSTRLGLNRRCILLNSHDLPCVFCFLNIEDNAHLFFFCPFSKGVWNAVFSWLGKDFPTGYCLVI